MDRLAPWGVLALLMLRELSFGLRFQLSGALVNGLTQGFAGFEVGNPLFGDGNALATAWIAAHTGRAAVDGETAKTTYLNAVASDQGIVHGIQNRLDGKFGIAMRQLLKPVRQFFHKIRSGHEMQFEKIENDRCPKLSRGGRSFDQVNISVNLRDRSLALSPN